MATEKKKLTHEERKARVKEVCWNAGQKHRAAEIKAATMVKNTIELGVVGAATYVRSNFTSPDAE